MPIDSENSSLEKEHSVGPAPWLFSSMDVEKEPAAEILLHSSPKHAKKVWGVTQRGKSYLKTIVSIILAIGLTVSAWSNLPCRRSQSVSASNTQAYEVDCKEVLSIWPTGHEDIYEQIGMTLNSSDYIQSSIDVFRQAIGIKTETSDDYGSVGEDNRWDKFFAFSAFLERSFPNVYGKLNVERVNTHGLLFTWNGETSTDESRPVMLLAHQDTVPVPLDTLSEWISDPFEANIVDGNFIGRGVHDDKNSLISILQALELLVEKGFKPQRTILAGFGFDEEVSGVRGAKQISALVESRYGKNGIAFILDEGPGISRIDDNSLATIATAEKGYLDLQLSVNVKGGHSSLATQHSAIGIMAEMIVSLENHDFDARVSRDSPTFEFVSCHSSIRQKKDSLVSTLLKRIMQGNTTAEYELGSILLGNPRFRPFVKTSQAIDLISGGQKINALPESVVTLINYRILQGSSLESVRQRAVELLKPIADKYQLDILAFEQEDKLSNLPARRLTISQIGAAIEPSRISLKGTEAQKVIFGSAKHAIGQHYSGPVLVSSSLMAGNTDTRHYWNLSTNLFRFRPTLIDEHNNNGHTINEHLRAADHFLAIDFYATLLLNADEISNSIM